MGPSTPGPAEILWPALLWVKSQSFVKWVWTIPFFAWGLELGTGPGRDGTWTWGLDFRLPHGGWVQDQEGGLMPGPHTEATTRA